METSVSGMKTPFVMVKRDEKGLLGSTGSTSEIDGRGKNVATAAIPPIRVADPKRKGSSSFCFLVFLALADGFFGLDFGALFDILHALKV